MTQLVDNIISLHVGSRFVLGIDGLSRSGKTTLTEELRKKLHQQQINVFIIHMDDHIVERKKRYHTGLEQWYEYYNLQWDMDYLRRQLFDKVHNHSELKLLFYNSELDEQFTKTVLIPSECVVIIEGVFLQRDEWREYFDYMVYLDCPKEIRFSRESASTRSDTQKFRDRYWRAEDHYLNKVNPLNNADMIIKSDKSMGGQQMSDVESCFDEVKLHKDIPFTEVMNEKGEQEQLKLDIYLPVGDKETNRPTIIWIHGGGFKPGRDKAQGYIVEFAERFAHKGYVCAAPDYRVRENPWNDFKGTIMDAVSDVSQALDWLRKNSESYGIDKERLFIAGGSAGGMIAVNMCYGDGTWGQQVDLSGVQAMLNLWGSPSELNLNVHAGSIPALTVHGTNDQLVKIENSYQFVNLLHVAGVQSVFVPLEGAPHTPMEHVERMDLEFTHFLRDILTKR